MRILNRRPLTVRKFCTNCDESCDKTANTPASLTMEAKKRASAGKAKNAAMPEMIDGTPTLSNVTSCIRVRSDFVCPTTVDTKLSTRDDSCVLACNLAIDLVV
mmetsp:Transcript_4579/g.8833  ORF Transcript_4579/g.8833 Transcript_4579/m.8833 type:complete len:103 (+) Transcript_4579:828-1136(+)